MAPRQLRGRQAVYLCTVPDDFRPQRLWDIPGAIVAATLQAKNLPMRSALGYARTHNKAAVQRLQAGQSLGLWAIVARHLRPNHHDRSEKGGLAS